MLLLTPDASKPLRRPSRAIGDGNLGRVAERSIGLPSKFGIVRQKGSLRDFECDMTRRNMENEAAA